MWNCSIVSCDFQTSELPDISDGQPGEGVEGFHHRGEDDSDAGLCPTERRFYCAQERGGAGCYYGFQSAPEEGSLRQQGTSGPSKSGERSLDVALGI